MYIILHPIIGLILGCLVFLAAYYRWKKKPTYFRYPLTNFLKNNGIATGSLPLILPWLLRIVTLLMLALIISRPQEIDVSSPVSIQGIDLILAIDVSGSMQLFDDLNDPRTRLEVAKQEATRFIERRLHDQCGLVLFGQQAVSRCPLTLDKKILTQLIEDITIGVLEEGGTMLGYGTLMAVNRLKNSKAKSKIIIILTDGQSTQPDISLTEVIPIAKKLGIKIYTIGIGNEEGGYLNHELVGLIMAQTPLNEQILQQLAQETGGQFFRASKPKDMRTIYEKIDALEKTTYESTLYYKTTEKFQLFAFIGLLAATLEWFLTTLLWFII